MELAQYVIDISDWGFRLKTFTFTDYSRSIVVGLIIFAFSFIFQEMRQAETARRQSEEEKRQSEALAPKAQVSALTAQMNPHLLFNALNSIAAMTQSNPSQAESMTVELSQLYRQVLEASKKDKHSLESELDLCRSYLQIEKIRFGKRVDYVIEVQEDLDLASIHVPVLCLQPLLENSLKHGIGPKVEGGRVDLVIRSDDSYLQMTIKDTGVGFDPSSSVRGSGTAIANCQARLQLLYGSRGKLEIESQPGQGTSVTLKMPFGEQTT
jgi:sensor histidine kinase YesM